MTALEFEAMGELYGVRFEMLAEATSTNDIAHEERFHDGDVVLALSQTKGRGQRGNVWESVPGENLTFSVVTRPTFLPAECQFLLSECAALSIVDTLIQYDIRAQIKWTNDIYVDSRKIAGILIENDLCGTNLSRSIIGIGLNVNQTEFSPLLPNPTSMALECDGNIDTESLFGRFYECFKNRYEMLRDGYVDDIMADYHAVLYRLNQRHEYYLPDNTPIHGTIRRVLDSGELIVEHDDGTTKGYLFKEIEFYIR